MAKIFDKDLNRHLIPQCSASTGDFVSEQCQSPLFPDPRIAGDVNGWCINNNKNSNKPVQPCKDTFAGVISVPQQLVQSDQPR